MPTLPVSLRRTLTVTATGLALLAPAAVDVSTAHAALPPSMSGEPPANPSPSTPTVDGFQLTHLPPGLGNRVTDFEYTWEDVDFRNLVWESVADEADGFRVDMNAHVLRGDLLTSNDTVRQYLSTYLERDPSSWHLQNLQLADTTALIGAEDVFWLVRPGVAIWISIDASRFSTGDLVSTAQGVQEVSPTPPPTP